MRSARSAKVARAAIAIVWIRSGHRAVAGLTKDRIESRRRFLDRFTTSPARRWTRSRSSEFSFVTPKTSNRSRLIRPMASSEGEIRTWTDAELAAFEKRWPFGTKQRAAYELMLNVGTARVDTHLTTWIQAGADDFEYTRRKTGVPVLVEKADSLRQALAALPRKHVCILTTEYGKPITVDGVSGWLRAAITSASIADLSRRSGDC